MWSEYSLDVVDAVARHGSFSAAAQELHRVPSAISYTVRQIEEWLAVPLFIRRHRDVELTPAGRLFIDEARGVMKTMLGSGRCGDAFGIVMVRGSLFLLCAHCMQ